MADRRSFFGVEVEMPWTTYPTRQAKIDAQLFDSIPDSADRYRKALAEATPAIRESYWRAMKRHKWLPLASLLPNWLLSRLERRYDDEAAFVNGPEYGSSFWGDATYWKYVRTDKRKHGQQPSNPG